VIWAGGCTWSARSIPTTARTCPTRTGFHTAYGRSLLTHDKRIRYRSAELGALADGGGTMFCLSSGNLMIQAVALYVVYADRIERRWP